MNTRYRQILWSNYRLEHLRHLLEQNSFFFFDAQRIPFENSRTDLYIYLIGTKFVDTIDKAAV